MGDFVIKLDNVSKNYRLPHEKTTTIKSLFTGLLHGNPFRKSYENLHALKNIDFEIKKGEFFGIVGRNGSGKSTLLKIIAGIYQPTKGSVHVSGKLVPFIELGVGFNPELTGKENVYLNGALLGFSRQEVDMFYDEVVEFAELEKFMDQKLKNYSSGMQVRLAFSMAIRAKADILLIDEVLAVGDTDFQRRCFDYFQKLKGNSTTVVFISHDMNAVREYCDRAILIDKSELVVEGSANKVAAEYTKMFINTAAGGMVDKSGKRWGDNALHFEKIEAPSKLTIDDDYLAFKVQVKANKRVKSPVIGFIVKNSAGADLVGTNTLIEGVQIRELKKDEILNLKLRLPNIFSDGVHHLTLAAVYRGGISVGDWWDEAALIKVFRKQATPYLLTPKIEIDIDYV